MVLDIEECKRKIVEYFANVSEEQFKKDLEECGKMLCPLCGNHLAKDCKLKLF